ncbi:MAG: hypothetical protein HOP19_11285, partial [Acidobacteria bacterium]|nr:hypothetical protein [Acidobacteriota bacterium]
MTTQTHSLNTAAQLPDWANDLARKYRAGEANHFLLHHNVYDLTRHGAGYLSLLGFLQNAVLGNKRIVLYNRSEGITFDSDETMRAFVAQQKVADPLLNIQNASQLPRDPAKALPMIERFLYYGDRVAVILNFLETIFPAGEISYLSGEDRTTLVTLQRWMTSARLMDTDNLVLMIAESQSDVHARIRENSRLASVKIPYPDEAQRLAYLQDFLKT